MKKTTLLLLVSFTVFSAFSQNKFWTSNLADKTDFSEKELYVRKSEPTEFKMYNLKLDQIQIMLSNVSSKSTQVIDLPTINGKIEKFTVKEASVIAPELAAKYPMIKSYVGQGISDPSMIARFSIGTDGLHAVIYSGDKETYYVDPYTRSNTNYIAYKRSSLENNDLDYQCLVDDSQVSTLTNNTNVIENADDGNLRTYRLALVSSAEYSEFHLENQGVENSLANFPAMKAAVLSAMNTSMTRINGVYERDLGVRMVIVPDNDKIIFFQASSDGISDVNQPNIASTIIGEVQTIADREIGDANYDIGHIFTINGSGLAGLGVVCVSGSKARGVTGRAAPIGDPYDIDYVAHEMGHQFGATHTQNNDCNRTDATAVEPGSASTIMGYAGICAPNVQSNSDDHFHAVSITQMWNNIQTSANCGALTATNNAAPTANAGADYSIPRLTPFVLKGQGTDVNEGNVLTYNWEQLDTEIATMPPSETSNAGPTFRSIPSSTSPDRYMPALATVVGGSTSSTWEVLSAMNRDYNFALVVRDNNPGGGSSARDDVKISSVFGNIFSVTSQNTTTTWDKETTQTVTWEVAGSNQAPVNCLKVNIRLSIDGGVTFPILLASNTDNDGTEDITVPDNGTTKARIMVEAADNIFYNVNAVEFTINGAVASTKDFAFDGFNLYPNPSKGTFNLNFDVVNTDKVSVQLFDLRGRLINQKDFFNTKANFSEQITFNKTTSGLYLVKITNGNKQTTRKLVIE
ncbi:T9SS type A sorting domain-containing protein [Polaribacter pectinis]|uniref:T9SS type A sorting domain-containing protein n=1 Tax=Polaribacter pectinis TaxID=2738844 RepID=A0A7G9LAC3_9FLAO|nr:zinc-dependent metalloprotease family protein [Polaribacter pectinis]QNM85572.1 T9SS type A sorting domain-containing protein [Polaribacter pectinis]